MSRIVKAGTITVTEAFIHHKADYETASWWTDFQIKPGTYDVTCAFSSREAVFPYMVWFKVPDAVVTASHFVNRLFQCSSSVDDKDVGKVREVAVNVSWNDPRISLTTEMTAMRDQERIVIAAYSSTAARVA